MPARPRYDRHRDQWTLYHQGKRRYLCAGAANEALAWTEAQKLRGDLLTTDTPRTVTEAADAWLTQRGTDWHRWILAPLLIYGITRLERVHAQYLEDYLLHLQRTGYDRTVDRAVTRKGKRVRERETVHREYSPSTLRRQLRFARTVLVWAHDRGYLTRPVPPMPKLPAIPVVDRSLARSQVQAIVAAVPKRARDLVAFIAMTGCRPDEACALRHDEIQGDRCELKRGKTYTRTGEPRVLYLNPAAKKILESRGTRTGYVFRNRNGEPYAPNGIRSIVKRAAQRCGIAKMTTYRLRHSWAQDALEATDEAGRPIMTLDLVGEGLGHAPGSPATRTYARIRQAKAAKAVQGLDALVSLDDVQPAPRPKRRGAGNSRSTAEPTPHETATSRGRRRSG